tara:strand:+ start:531 stop:815 length:285 start_codon:yes stop_codon:yes gene_type:complete
LFQRVPAGGSAKYYSLAREDSWKKQDFAQRPLSLEAFLQKCLISFGGRYNILVAFNILLFLILFLKARRRVRTGVCKLNLKEKCNRKRSQKQKL